MSRTFSILVCFFAAGSLCAQDLSKEKFAPWVYPVGDFSLQDRAGEKVSPRDLRGSIWVAHFSSQCTGACTKSTPNMKSCRRHRAKRMKFVSIAFAATRSTRSIVTLEMQPKPGQWYFLTDSNEDRVHDIIRSAFLTSR